MSNPNDASIYEVQTGAFATFTFVTCDSVIVTAEGPTGFWVEEPFPAASLAGSFSGGV